MVVDFSSIRPHLQPFVLRKFDFPVFSRFSQCSKEALSLSKSIKGRLPWNAGTSYIKVTENDVIVPKLVNTKLPTLSLFLEEYPVKISFSSIYFNEVSNEALNKLTGMLESHKIKINEFIFARHTKADFTPEQFNHLLKASNVQKFTSPFSRSIYTEHLRQPQFRKIPAIEFYCRDPIPFDVILSLEATKLELGAVALNPQEINIFLKQWSEGSRDILKIDFKYPLGLWEMEEDEVAFEGISHEILGSKDFHRCYVLKRGNEQIMAHIYKNVLVLQPENNPQAKLRYEIFPV